MWIMRSFRLFESQLRVPFVTTTTAIILSNKYEYVQGDVENRENQGDTFRFKPGGVPRESEIFFSRPAQNMASISSCR